MFKRYLLFGFSTYYPYGGWHDFKGDYDTLSEVYPKLLEFKDAFDQFHVIDTTTQKFLSETAVFNDDQLSKSP
jgi:hypothetical protein